MIQEEKQKVLNMELDSATEFYDKGMLFVAVPATEDDVMALKMYAVKQMQKIKEEK